MIDGREGKQSFKGIRKELMLIENELVKGAFKELNRESNRKDCVFLSPVMLSIFY